MCSLLHLWSFLPGLLITSQLSEDRNRKLTILVYFENTLHHFILFISIHSLQSSNEVDTVNIYVPNRETEPEWFSQGHVARKQWMRDLNSHLCSSRFCDFLANLLACYAGCLFRPHVKQRNILSLFSPWHDSGLLEDILKHKGLGLQSRVFDAMLLVQALRTLSSGKFLDSAGAAGPCLKNHCCVQNWGFQTWLL